MTKETYFQMLRRRLKKLPDDDREKILAFYQEIVEDKIESGIPEEQALADLGDVQQLAQKILSENSNRRPGGAKPFLVALGVTVLVLFLLTGIFYASFLLPGSWEEDHFSSSLEVSSERTLPDFSKPEQAPSQPAMLVDPTASGVKETKEFVLPLSDVRELKLDVQNKQVQLEAIEGTEFHIQYETDETQVYTLLQEKPGEYEVKNQDLSRNIPYDENREMYRITVQVPKEYAGKLKAETGNGYIAAKELQNLEELDCEAVNAEIKLEKISALEVSIETSNGRVSIETVQAGTKLDVETKNGEIELQSCSADTVEVETNNGQISLQSVEAPVKTDVKTSNGMIVFSGLRSPDISLKTNNGAVGGSIQGKKSDYQIQTSKTLGSNNLENKSGGSKKLQVETRIGAIDVTFEE